MGADLLEREKEVGRLEELVSAAAGGAGRVASLVGPAGIGKSTLLAALEELGARRGMDVLTARGGELERDLPFGVVRQLFEPRLARTTPEERSTLFAGAAGLARPALSLEGGDPEAGGADPFAVQHGLYWLSANLADEQPTLFLIDDAHWSDAQSLRWVDYLRRRIEGLPVLAVLAARSDEAWSPELAAAVEDPDHTLTPAPLGAGAAASLIRARFDPGADEAFCRTCHEATGGNPFLLLELLRALGGDGSPVDAARPDRIGAVGPATVARSALDRVGRVGEPAVRLAKAVAILGADAELRHAAELADLGFDEALGVADGLRTAGILRSGGALEFLHPIVRQAIREEILPGERAHLHKRAARLLDADQAGSRRIAAHLLVCEPLRDPWVVEQLRAAARDAVASGAPDAAAEQLARALREPPPAAERPHVHAELGRALAALDPASAIEQFEAALATADDPGLRVDVSLAMAKACAHADRPAESLRVLDATLSAAREGDEETALRLESELLLWSAFWADDPEGPGRPERLRKAATARPGATPGERSLLGLLAWNLMLGAAPAAEALDHAERARSEPLRFTDPVQGFEIPTVISLVYMYCDELDVALRLFDEAIVELRSKGWLVHVAFAHAHRSHVQLRQGRLLEAEADARTSWHLASDLGPGVPAWWYSVGNLIQILIARGALEEAGRVVEANGLGEALPDALIFPLPRIVRGELRIALGELESGVDDLLQAGRWMEARGLSNPSWGSWRASAARALVDLRRTEEADALIADGLESARRFGAPWGLGQMLRAAGTVQPGGDGIACLYEAVELLDASPARLEHAKALVDLGSTLRRANRRAEARDVLRKGAVAADECGAGGLAARAHDELAIAGARPRREVLRGPDALTAAELRTARLAAEGKTNRDIAQMLFVTAKTVETQLSSAYAKLEIDSRRSLPDALTGVRAP